jgi:hypothetical protein
MRIGQAISVDIGLILADGVRYRYHVSLALLQGGPQRCVCAGVRGAERSSALISSAPHAALKQRSPAQSRAEGAL